MRAKRIRGRRPRITRTTLGKRIAAAKTEQEKLNLVLFGRERPLNRVQRLVQSWRVLIDLRDHPDRREKQIDFHQKLFKDTKLETWQYVRDAMFAWNPQMLIGLAREMKRLEKAKSWGATPEAYLVLNAKCGPLNLAELKRYAEQVRPEWARVFASLKTWRRAAHRLGSSVRNAGRPPK